MSAVKYLQKLTIAFYKDHANKVRVTLSLIDTLPPIAMLIRPLNRKQKLE